jgi:hypothetical protein
MGFYGNHIVPRLIHLAMRNDLLTPYRRRVLSAASGRVLKIGIGSGVNLPFCRTAVRHIIRIEPSPKLLEMRSRAPELIEGPARSGRGALPTGGRSCHPTRAARRGSVRVPAARSPPIGPGSNDVVKTRQECMHPSLRGFAIAWLARVAAENNPERSGTTKRFMHDLIGSRRIGVSPERWLILVRHGNNR